MFAVTALGVVNTGKSAVLSALADRPGLFPEGEEPGLTRHRQQEVASVLTLVDTPGLDGDPARADEALREALRADVVLWCHSLRMGELRPTELSSLQRYARHSRTIWKTCFVLTHADNVASREVVRTVSGVIADQLGAVFGLRFVAVDQFLPTAPPSERRPRPFNALGVRDYWLSARLTGERQKRLAAQSGIPRLRRFLEEQAGNRGQR
jgi:hypothetical protein